MLAKHWPACVERWPRSSSTHNRMPASMSDGAVKAGEAGARSSGAQSRLASLGAVGAAVGASLCCVGPVLFVTFGVGAGLASMFDPLRWPLTALTVALLALGFYSVYGRSASRATTSASPDATVGKGEGCAVPRNRRREKVVLWVATAVALILLTFPRWSLLLV